MKNILEDIKPIIIESLKNYDVIHASIFGSIARGDAIENSDIDILVEFEGNKSLLDLAGLKIELEEKLNCKVDVLTYNSIHPLLKSHILNEQIVIL
ncbi:MAG: nucleotidyltransferase family protein [Candidatus Lokiarchaeota archaeon]|nr:nucleotidyltransferase family protein [Candidatus Lokiarchaeota archaeon]